MESQVWRCTVHPYRHLRAKHHLEKQSLSCLRILLPTIAPGVCPFLWKEAAAPVALPMRAGLGAPGLIPPIHPVSPWAELMLMPVDAHVHSLQSAVCPPRSDPGDLCIRGQLVHLVCTGALTNAALLLMLYPEVGACLKEIVVMGGCLGIGNTHPVAEFNMQARPACPACACPSAGARAKAIRPAERTAIHANVHPLGQFSRS